MLNPHHLELFYYVARHGGISAAVRHIPYGIQQPAVSLQIVRLEETLNTTLFHRRPFALTDAGEKLFAHVRPFFEGLPAVEEQLRIGKADQLRIGAAEIFQREHLPAVLAHLQPQVPGLRTTLRTGTLAQFVEWLRSGELDVALGVHSGKPPPGIKSIPLGQFSPALLCPTRLRLKSAEEIWALDRIPHPLLALPAHEPLCRAFADGLARRGLAWEPAMELGSLQLVERYAQEGFGIGLTFSIAGKKPPAGMRLLPLENFPPLTIAILWNGAPSALKTVFIEATVATAKKILSPR